MYNVYALYIYRFLNAQVTTYNTFKHNVDILTIRELCASFVLEWEMIFIVSNYQTINIVQVISCYMDVHGVKKKCYRTWHFERESGIAFMAQDLSVLQFSIINIY